MKLKVRKSDCFMWFAYLVIGTTEDGFTQGSDLVYNGKFGKRWSNAACSD